MYSSPSLLAVGKASSRATCRCRDAMCQVLASLEWHVSMQSLEPGAYLWCVVAGCRKGIAKYFGVHCL